MTVSELISLLQTFPQDLPVEMGMNGEYQCPVTPDMLVVDTYDGETYLIIDDCPQR